MIISATGHRPDKIGGYGPAASLRRRAVAMDALLAWGPNECISGMALGWDTDFALACIELGIPFTAAVPFEGQEGKWPAQSQRVFHAVLSYAAKVVVVSPGGYSPRKMQIRNQWMVDNSDIVLALWDGSDGGTANCVGYARAKEKRVHNVWERFACA